MTPPGNWKKEWRQQRLMFITDKEKLSSNRIKFRKRYKSEGRDMSEYKHFRRDYLRCYILFCLTADEYFQYDFFNKGWIWRNHHITIERREFIDSRLNDSNAIKVLANKSEFNNYYKDYIYRAWCDMTEVSEEEFINTFLDCERIIIKPCGKFGGKGIEAYNTDRETLAKVYKDKHKKKYIVEEYLNQTGVFHDINPESLNSIRITSVRQNGNVEIVDGFFRCGCGNVVVDNFSSGGLIFPYDVKTGRLYCGHSKHDSEVLVHPHTGIEVADLIIPEYERIIEIIKEVHMMSPEGISLVGWDVCLIDDKVILIEGNSKPGYTVLYDPKNNLWKKMKKHF